LRETCGHSIFFLLFFGRCWRVLRITSFQGFPISFPDFPLQHLSFPDFFFSPTFVQGRNVLSTSFPLFFLSFFPLADPFFPFSPSQGPKSASLSSFFFFFSPLIGGSRGAPFLFLFPLSLSVFSSQSVTAFRGLQAFFFSFCCR